MSLVEQYRMMHQAGHFPGFSMKKHLGEIRRFADSIKAKSLLDFGCGKGEQWRDDKVREILLKPSGPIEDLFLYEPAIPPMKYLPEEPVDLVISTDVMEHIPEDELEDTLQTIFGLAKSGVFLSICCRPAKKVLPDGRNAHVTIRPQWWWEGLVGLHKPKRVETCIVWNE